MSVLKKKTIKTVDKDGKELTLDIKLPSAQVKAGAEKAFNQRWREALENGAPLNLEVERISENRGLWTQKQQAELEAKSRRLGEIRLALKKGGIKKSEARDLALEAQNLYLDLRALADERNSLGLETVESRALQAQFDYYVAFCTVYNSTGNPYFKDVEDYLSRATEQASIDAAKAVSEFIYGVATDFYKTFPENEFLVKYGYANEELRLVDKAGEFVDAKGRRVDKEGFLINSDGKRIDEDGNPIEVEFTEFLDD